MRKPRGHEEANQESGGPCIFRLPRWLRRYGSHLQRRRPRFDPRVGKIRWRRACNPLDYPGLENPLDRGARRAAVHGGRRAPNTPGRPTRAWLSASAEVLLSAGPTAPSPGLRLTMALPLQGQRFRRARVASQAACKRSPERKPSLSRI